jgi:hypothetical protein
MLTPQITIICRAQAIFLTGKRPETHYARDCVGFRAGLDGFGLSILLQDTILSMVVQLPVCYYYNV